MEGPACTFQFKIVWSFCGTGTARPRKRHREEPRIEVKLGFSSLDRDAKGTVDRSKHETVISNVLMGPEEKERHGRITMDRALAGHRQRAIWSPRSIFAFQLSVATTSPLFA